MMESTQECARLVLETVPVVMRFIRAEMRSHRAADLSVPQFRSMAFIDRKSEASLGELAEHLGIAPATASKMVDGLEERRLLTRGHSSADRRRIVLALTPDGRRMMTAARREAQMSLASALAVLDPTDRETVERAMVVLNGSFAGLSRARCR
jgi:DNA-binding MarR family transcriptional regulator